MARKVCIAIDGPVASGKSTIGRTLAEALGYLYLDTGAMYRGVTSQVLALGIDPADEAKVTKVAQAVRFSFPDLATAQSVNQPLLADGVDITDSLRLPRVDQNVSTISSFPGVREAMVSQQRRIREEHSVVMVGRDIGTVVAPDADVKIFLSASVEDRAKRRHAERVAAGLDESYGMTLADLKRRDQLDSERTLSPLRPAADAVFVDTTGYSVDQASACILKLVRLRLEGATA